MSNSGLRPEFTSLEMHDLSYADPEQATIAQRKKAILRGDTLARRIKGRLVLKSPDGKLLTCVTW